MTIKQFLQSKIFRCIIVLLCIALVSGGLLAILNDVLAVDDAELLQRGLKSVGIQESNPQELEIQKADYDNGTIIQVIFLPSTGDYLIKALGKGGFQQGTVTVYALAHIEESNVSIKKVAIAEYASSQTLMSKITDAGLQKVADDPSIAPNQIATGATYSSTAIKNAVNTAISYINDYLA